jgi:hypothetical protein
MILIKDDLFLTAIAVEGWLLSTGLGDFSAVENVFTDFMKTAV